MIILLLTKKITPDFEHEQSTCLAKALALVSYSGVVLEKLASRVGLETNVLQMKIDAYRGVDYQFLVKEGEND